MSESHSENQSKMRVTVPNAAESVREQPPTTANANHRDSSLATHWAFNDSAARQTYTTTRLQSLFVGTNRALEASALDSHLDRTLALDNVDRANQEYTAGSGFLRKLIAQVTEKDEEATLYTHTNKSSPLLSQIPNRDSKASEDLVNRPLESVLPNGPTLWTPSSQNPSTDLMESGTNVRLLEFGMIPHHFRPAGSGTGTAATCLPPACDSDYMEQWGWTPNEDAEDLELNLAMHASLESYRLHTLVTHMHQTGLAASLKAAGVSYELPGLNSSLRTRKSIDDCIAQLLAMPLEQRAEFQFSSENACEFELDDADTNTIRETDSSAGDAPSPASSTSVYYNYIEGPSSIASSPAFFGNASLNTQAIGAEGFQSFDSVWNWVDRTAHAQAVDSDISDWDRCDDLSTTSGAETSDFEQVGMSEDDEEINLNGNQSMGWRA